MVTSLKALAPGGGFYAVVRKDGAVLEAVAVPPPTLPEPTIPVSPPVLTGGTAQAVPPVPAPKAPPSVPTPVTPVPKGGALVAGVGDGAAWMQANVRLGGKVAFDTEPELRVSDALYDAGVRLFTLAMEGPDYDYGIVERWLAWRDRRNS